MGCQAGGDGSPIGVWVAELGRVGRELSGVLGPRMGVLVGFGVL